MSEEKVNRQKRTDKTSPQTETPSSDQTLPSSFDVNVLVTPLSEVWAYYHLHASPEDKQISDLIRMTAMGAIESLPGVTQVHLGMFASEMTIATFGLQAAPMEDGPTEEVVGHLMLEGEGVGGDRPFRLHDFTEGLRSVIARRAAGTLSAEQSAVVVSIFGADVFKALNR